MNVSDVKAEVGALTTRLRWEREEDAFPIWYLRRRFPFLSELDAQRQCADPAILGEGRNNDFGIDGYHIAVDAETPYLLVLQAKYSADQQQINKGFRDLARAVACVARALTAPIDAEQGPANKVVSNLRAEVGLLDERLRRRLMIEWVVLHLGADDRESRKRRSANAREELNEKLQLCFEDARLSVVQDIGPTEIITPWHEPPPPPPDPWYSLTMSSVGLTSSHDGSEVRMLFGVGRLSELVDLYESRRQGLFEKNVRSFQDTKKNKTHGPYGEMRKTLRSMCIESRNEPELFGFLHNGVTLSCRSAKQTGTGVEVQGPYVLNGCQTITAAYDFHSDPLVQRRLAEDRWMRVTLPVRVVVTSDDDFIRNVTICNNRQNEIRPAALKANDLLQLDLQRRFREVRIYYERQLGAFKAMNDADQQRFYPNGQGHCVTITSLARAIAAGSGDMDGAYHPDHLFQSDASYTRCFSKDHLRSLPLLVFLQNLNDVLAVVLTNELDLRRSGDGPRPKRLVYYALNLFVRLLAKEKNESLVREWGRKLWWRHQDLRQQVGSAMGNHRLRVKAALRDRFIALEDQKAENLKLAMRRAESDLGLRDSHDPFVVFADLETEDEEVV